MLPSHITISSRFNGPPYSGNGGYSCGILGKYIDGPAEVMLRVPPPLDKSMTLHKEGDQVMMKDGDQVVGIATPKAFDADLPAPISLDEAKTSASRYIAYDHHHFTTCFVCGPGRDQGDGLRIFAGATGAPDVVAAPWTPSDDLFDEEGRLKEEFYWAAMDCPSYFAIVGDTMKVLLLGKMSCHIENEILKGEEIVVMAWKEQSDGRKHHSGTVLYGTDGTLKSYSKNLWIALSEEQMQKIGAQQRGNA